jgi:hypothetical protein
MRKRTVEEARNRINRLSEGLFGSPEEITTEEAEEVLTEAGIDIERLHDRLYDRLHKEAQRFWGERKELPPLLKEALSELRPLSVNPQSDAELTRQARTNVDRIVDKAKMLGSLLPGAPPRFAESYRNKTGVTKQDREKLDKVRSALQNKIESIREKK